MRRPGYRECANCAIHRNATVARATIATPRPDPLAVPETGDTRGLAGIRYWSGGVARHAFPDSGAEFGARTTCPDHDEPGGFRALSDFGRSVLRNAFEMWDELSGLRLSEADDGEAAQINVGGSSAPHRLGLLTRQWDGQRRHLGSTPADPSCRRCRRAPR